MPRAEDLPVCPGKPTPPAKADRSFEVELITPMFGGGAETRANDPSFPIRPTAIRGQFQFWWRATVGARCSTRQELRAAQSRIWGSTERASPVQVQVEVVGKPNNPTPAGRYERQGEKFRSIPNWDPPFRGLPALPYALFPFQGRLSKDRRQIEELPASCITRASFRLILRCPNDLWAELEPAVWAWGNFGGLGCRTRRGCGAVRCKGLAPRDQAELVGQLSRFAPHQEAIRDWPTVDAGLLIGKQSGDPLVEWDRVIGLMKNFRQGVPFARDPGPGRSHYPEPEAIRTILYDPDHPWRHDRLQHVPNHAFPRAELGLPIVFHFKPPQEPIDTVLYPSNDSEGNRRERMASPLILKPLALANGKALPLVLRLKTPPLDGVDLRTVRPDQSLPLPPSTVIRDPSLARYQGSPLDASANGSALEAFLAFARANGFTEVNR
jgi:CRISPR-associated protein Cmr1